MNTEQLMKNESTSKMFNCLRYTEHSTVGLAQQWDQLNQLGMRIRHNLEQQIQVGTIKLSSMIDSWRFVINQCNNLLINWLFYILTHGLID